jgi:SSS family transporter
MAQFHISPADYVVMGGYFVIVLWIGLHFRNRMEAAQDFFAGGHQIPWWLAGISHYMSSFSAFSFIAYAQVGYTYGWVSVTLFWMSVPACVLGGLFFAQRWRRARIITPVEFLERRFNALIRQLFAWAGIPMKVFDDALKVFATGLFVSLAVGLDVRLAILLCGLVMVAYSFLGGLWALVVTDYVQFLMKALAILLLLPLALMRAGGPARALSGLPAGFFHPINGPYGWTYILGFGMIILISYNASWSLAQKYYSVPNERDARKTAYFAALLNCVGAPLMILPSIMARNLLPELLSQGRTADVYVLLVLRLLPVGMIGIIVAAMFSSTMAVVSADFNAIASVLTKDVYQRLMNARASDRHLLYVGRVVTLALGALTIGLSLVIALTRQQFLFSTMATVLGLFMAPTLLPLLAGLTVRRLTWQGAFAGFLSGLATGIFMLALKTWWLPQSGRVALFGSVYNFEGIGFLANVALTLIGMMAGTLLTSTAGAEPEAVRIFFREIDKPVTAAETRSTMGTGTNSVIGISTLGVAALLFLAGLLSGARFAAVIDICCAALLGLLGFLLLRKKPPVPRSEVDLAESSGL